VTVRHWGLSPGDGAIGLDEVPGVLAEDVAQVTALGGDRLGVGGIPGGYHGAPPKALKVLMYW
jgi:hypothetical protein